MSAEHAGSVAGADCPACGPLVLAARAAEQAWTRAQLGGRGSAAYRLAAREMRSASAALLASKREHYRNEGATVLPRRYR